MRWALVIMRLCAACRNTSVRRTTGRAPDEMRSDMTCPGPTEGSWSMSPTTSKAGFIGHRFHERLHQHDIDHGSLVDNQQIAVQRVVVATLETASLGINLEQPMNGL